MGKLITVEGGEYTGKTKIIVPAVANTLKENNWDVVVSREPGGTEQGEEIREKIFRRLREGARQDELADLFFEAREIHLIEVVWPHIGRNKEMPNKAVVLDRYADTTRVLQGMEGGVEMPRLRQMEQEKAHGFYPDLTMITYIPDEVFDDVMNTRRQQANQESGRSKTKWDEGDNSLQLIRQREYLSLPDLFIEEGIERKWSRIDTSKSTADVAKQVREALKSAGLI